MKELTATASVQTKVGRTKIHKKLIIEIPELGRLIKEGYVKKTDSRYTQGTWLEHAYRQGATADFQVILHINRDTGRFEIPMAKKDASNWAKISARKED